MKKVLCIAIALVFALLLAGPVMAGRSDGEGSQKLKDSKESLEAMMGSDETAIPEYLIDKCQAIAIFPGIKKIGFGIGGHQGWGLLMARDENRKWSPPAFFRLRGLSTGFQIGLQEMDTVLLIMDKKGLTSFMGNEFTVGADLSIAAGPTKKAVDADTTTALDSNLLSYTLVKRGLYAGVAVKGSRIVFDSEMTDDFYNKPLKCEDILKNGKVPMPDEAKPLVEALEKYAKAKKDEAKKEEKTQDQKK